MEFKMFSILKHLSQIHLSIIQQEEKKTKKQTLSRHIARLGCLRTEL